MPDNVLELWLAGLSVLECEFSTEVKKEILLSQLKDSNIQKPEKTGLIPFDNAIENTYSRYFNNDSISE